MASKFGILGDVDKLLTESRSSVSFAAGTISNVRRALEDVPLTELTPEILGRLVSLLAQAEIKLDSLLNRD